MMASQASKYHDPMYNFDTHYPERLSRLHLHNDAPASFRKKKPRAQRSGARYKTQPVTFAEITEVDEEPVASPGEEKQTGDTKGLMGQLQAFSRSMDGLLPRASSHENSPVGHHVNVSHSRSGSRKFQRHPQCIPERVEAENATSPQPNTSEKQHHFGMHTAENRVSDISLAVTAAEIPSLTPNPSAFASVSASKPSPSNSPSSAVSSSSPNTDKLQMGGSCLEKSRSEIASSFFSSSTSASGPSSTSGKAAEHAITPSNMAPRRTKVTAKAKKRQKASEEGKGQ